MLDKPGSVFYDSNVLLYGLRGDPDRVGIVRDLLGLRGNASVQVLNEVANVCRKKMAMSVPEIDSFLRPLRTLLHIGPVTLAVHERGLNLLSRYNFSIYDAMVVAAALEANCNVLYSEDMHDGLVVDGRLTIRNPFLAV